MSVLYYIGLDIHKKTIVYCIKKVVGTLVPIYPRLNNMLLFSHYFTY